MRGFRRAARTEFVEVRASLAALDTEKHETKFPIDRGDDIFTYADQIRAIAAAYAAPD